MISRRPLASLALRLLALAALPLALSCACSASAQPAGPYRLVREIPIGTPGGWDYLSVNPAARRLYVAHGTQVVVIDTATDTVVGVIPDTPGVHGLAPVPALGRGFISEGKADRIGIVDLATLAPLGESPAGHNPDAILFEPLRGEVYAFNGRSHSATVLDAASGRVVATIALDGKPEFSQADPAAGRVYVNFEDKSEVAAIDVRTHAVVARWPIAPGEGPTGLAFDAAHHRLLVGCDGVLVVLDSASGAVVATVPVGDGVDAAAFDPGTGDAFTSNGASGTVSVVHEDSPDKFTLVQTLATEKGARTMQVDPVTHKIYLASAKFEDPAQASAGTAPAGGHAKPKIVPGTFKVLVYAPAP